MSKAAVASGQSLRGKCDVAPEHVLRRKVRLRDSLNSRLVTRGQSGRSPCPRDSGPEESLDTDGLTATVAGPVCGDRASEGTWPLL